MSGLRDFHSARWDEPLIMQKGVPGRRGILPPRTPPELQQGDALSQLPSEIRRDVAPNLPELSQPEVVRHYLRLSQMTLGAHLTPDASLGTCTMKYSPVVNESICRTAKLTDLHPMQDSTTLQGVLEIIVRFERILCELSGLDAFSFQPASGTLGIFANASIIREYHRSRGEADQRTQILTTSFSHPANAAAASVAGFEVLTLPPGPKGYPEVEGIRSVVSERTAGLMITNPEDTGLYNPSIGEFTRLVHDAGGLCSYDQANANGLLGITRAREAGFDLCQYNLHKTFAVPHGSSGGGAGAIGVREDLEKYLPVPTVSFDGTSYGLDYDRPESIGTVRSFHGNPQAVIRSYAWVMSLGLEGLKAVAETAVLNSNYLADHLERIPGVEIAFSERVRRLAEVRYSWKPLADETGVGTEDIRRRVCDFGLQSYVTSHHPMLVPEPFTLEPTETLSKEDLDEYIDVLSYVSDEARRAPDTVKQAPYSCAIHRVDESALHDPARWAMTWRAWTKKHDRESETSEALPSER